MAAQNYALDLYIKQTPLPAHPVHGECTNKCNFWFGPHNTTICKTHYCRVHNCSPKCRLYDNNGFQTCTITGVQDIQPTLHSNDHYKDDDDEDTERMSTFRRPMSVRMPTHANAYPSYSSPKEPRVNPRKLYKFNRVLLYAFYRLSAESVEQNESCNLISDQQCALYKIKVCNCIQAIWVKLSGVKIAVRSMLYFCLAALVLLSPDGHKKYPSNLPQLMEIDHFESLIGNSIEEVLYINKPKTRNNSSTIPKLLAVKFKPNAINKLAYQVFRQTIRTAAIDVHIRKIREHVGVPPIPT